jgi:hypothetical protein
MDEPSLEMVGTVLRANDAVIGLSRRISGRPLAVHHERAVLWAKEMLAELCAPARDVSTWIPTEALEERVWIYRAGESYLAERGQESAVPAYFNRLRVLMEAVDGLKEPEEVEGRFKELLDFFSYLGDR